jgi:hypothetical protein
VDVPQTHSFTSEENRGACQLSSCHSGLVSGSERCDFARATTKAGNRQGCRHTLRLLPCSPSTLLLSSHRFATLNAPRESSRAASDYQLLQQRQPACPHLQVLPLVPLTDVQVGPLSTLLCRTQAQQVLCSRVWAVGHRGAGVGDTPVPSVSKGTGDRVSGMHLYLQYLRAQGIGCRGCTCTADMGERRVVPALCACHVPEATSWAHHCRARRWYLLQERRVVN